MEEEHRITYRAGITRNPSDFLCADGELAECINLTTDNEEIKPMVQPASYITSAREGQSSIDMPTFLYVHKFNDEDRYIGYVSETNDNVTTYPLVWGVRNNSIFIKKGVLDNVQYSSDIKITSVGKTVIVCTSDGIKYYLWKPDSYKNLGEIPVQKVSFTMKWEPNSISAGVINSGSMEGIEWEDTGGSYKVKASSIESWNDLVIGLYSKNKRMVGKNKAFCNPFYARTALELYDGTYTHISAPVLLMPSVTRNTVATQMEMGGNLQLSTSAKHLYYWNESFTEVSEGGTTVRHSWFEDWTDIVKNIVIFITDGIELNDLSIDQPNHSFNFNQPTALSHDGVYADTNDLDMTYHPSSSVTGENVTALRDWKDVRTDLCSVSLFYKLCAFGATDDDSYSFGRNVADKITRNTLENLTTQEFLENDDFFSHCKLVPKYVYSYNSRLNIANVSRTFFEGFDYFMPLDREDTNREHTNDILIYVTLQTDNGNRVVRHRGISRYVMTKYFFYPDPRAKHFEIYRKRTPDSSGVEKWDRLKWYADEPEFGKLTEHAGLNGAFFLADHKPGAQYDQERYEGKDGQDPDANNAFLDDDLPAYDNDTPEQLSNYIIQSESNNPWVFKAEGYFKVGTGKILAMSTITQALSQGQFGQYPLLVFSESGIWALSVGSEGYYVAIYPMSRDVCINPGSILQTDGAVFFVSKKGLMVIAGNEVRCVSERMNGVTFNTATLTGIADNTDWEDAVEACQGANSFLDYIRSSKCFMAYDYVDSRIHIINSDYSFSYVFNIADGTISKTILPAAMTNAVNNYPDYLIQGEWSEIVEQQTVTHKGVYSFYEKKREEEVTGRQLGFLLTRPMKLSGPTAKASLRQLMHVGMWNKGTSSNPLSCVKTEIWLSDDLQTWYSDISRFGTAAKYYRLALYIKMLPTERLSGTILTEQPRRTKNLK